jgi:hypothetical protein
MSDKKTSDDTTLSDSQNESNIEDFYDFEQSSTATELEQNLADDPEPERGEFLPYDFASAYEALNKERREMFGEAYSPDDSSPKHIPELSTEVMVAYIQAHGITSFLNKVKDALDKKGYIKIGSSEFMHPKSGILTKF